MDDLETLEIVNKMHESNELTFSGAVRQLENSNNNYLEKIKALEEKLKFISEEVTN